MHEQCRRPGRTQRSRDLARNDATLAHARDHYPAAAGIDQFDRLVERLGHGTGDAIRQRTQGLSFDPDYVFADMLHGRKRC